MRFLVVGYDRSVGARVEHELQGEFGDAEVVLVFGEETMGRLLEEGRPDAVITEFQLPWGDALREIDRVRESWSGVPVVVFTAGGSEQAAAAALNAGVDRYVARSEETLSRIGLTVRATVKRSVERRATAQAEGRYRDFFESLPLALYLSFADGMLLGANEAMVQLLGFPDRQTLLGTKMPELYVQPDVRERWKERVIDEGVVQGFEVQLRRWDGSAVWVRDTTRAVWGEERETVVFQGCLEDISQRRIVERALRDSEARYRTLFESANDGIFLIEGERFYDCNNRTLEMFARSREEILHRRPYDLSPVTQPDGQDSKAKAHEMIRATLDGQPQYFEWRHHRPDGELFDTEVSLNRVVLEGRPFLQAIVRDVTSEREAKRQLQIQERLAAVGQLAAGIAHDFNNMLQAIILHVELSRNAAAEGDPVRRRLDAIQRQCTQGANLIRQILDFARKTVTLPQPLELVPFVREAVKLLQSAIPESVNLSLEVGNGELWVVADVAQVQQLLANLAVNAADAMPRGGDLHFRLDELELGAGEEPPLPEMAAGRWVKLTVTDTGCGMSREVRERVFEPFFTTKTPGRATGLGLAQVYGIVKQHSGYVAVSSEEGQGTTIAVYLPAADAQSVPGNAGALAADVPRGHGELVLVVEDDPAILDTARDGLKALGYRVVTASDGGEALELFESLGGEVDLVLSDLVMPGTGGVELARQLHQLESRAKILLMTGYPLDRDSGEHLALGIVDWIQKPFSMTQLAEAAARVLESESDSESPAS